MIVTDVDRVINRRSNIACKTALILQKNKTIDAKFHKTSLSLSFLRVNQNSSQMGHFINV